MKTIAVVNPKGGAGKTVSAINIAYALQRNDKKVLLIDTDPSCSIETYFNIKNDKNLFELIKEQYENLYVEDLNSYINSINGVDIIVSSYMLRNIDYYFMQNNDGQGVYNCIKNLIQYFGNYDYVIFDTEGTINNLTFSVLNATDYIFTPTKETKLDVNGIIDLKTLFTTAKKNNPKIQIKLIFMVGISSNTKVFKIAKERFEKYFTGKDDYKFSETVIRKDQNVANAAEEGKDIFSYKNSSGASIDYKNLVYEFLETEN